MAAATIEGLGGNAAFTAGWTFKVASWSADYNVEVADTTGFGDGGFRAKAPVIASMTGSMAGTGQSATTVPVPAGMANGTTMSVGDLAGATTTVTLTATTGCTYAFSAVITRLSMSRPVDGKMDVSADFESSGPITQSWTTA